MFTNLNFKNYVTIFYKNSKSMFPKIVDNFQKILLLCLYNLRSDQNRFLGYNNFSIYSNVYHNTTHLAAFLASMKLTHGEFYNG